MALPMRERSKVRWTQGGQGRRFAEEWLQNESMRESNMRVEFVARDSDRSNARVEWQRSSATEAPQCISCSDVPLRAFPRGSSSFALGICISDPNSRHSAHRNKHRQSNRLLGVSSACKPFHCLLIQLESAQQHDLGHVKHTPPSSGKLVLQALNMRCASCAADILQTFALGSSIRRERDEICV